MDNLQTELALLNRLLGDARMRFRKQQTPGASAEALIEVDSEIRALLSKPVTSAQQPEVARLTQRLQELDPH